MYEDKREEQFDIYIEDHDRLFSEEEIQRMKTFAAQTGGRKKE